jgi:hypothetical protein
MVHRKNLPWYLTTIALLPFLIVLSARVVEGLNVKLSWILHEYRLLEWIALFLFVFALLGIPALTIIMTLSPAKDRPRTWKIAASLIIAWLTWPLTAVMLWFLIGFWDGIAHA